MRIVYQALDKLSFTMTMGLGYSTLSGSAFLSTIEDFVDSKEAKPFIGKVDLLLTSPPFALTSPKAYGNKQGVDYKNWLVSLAPKLADFLSPTGSMVIEIGNNWNPKSPTMSTVALETLIEIKNRADLNVCQQFICHNPARLPTPATWVNVKRIRVKDSYTHVWWYSKTEFPKADNRKVLQPYTDAMKALLKRQSYNAGTRPSGHQISETSFLSDNGGSIPPSVLQFSGTPHDRGYRQWCKEQGVKAHPARMQKGLAEFFINLCTDSGDLVFDPFGGSNTTGSEAERLSRRWLITEPDRDYLLGSIGRFGPLGLEVNL